MESKKTNKQTLKHIPASKTRKQARRKNADEVDVLCTELLVPLCILRVGALRGMLPDGAMV